MTNRTVTAFPRHRGLSQRAIRVPPGAKSRGPEDTLARAGVRGGGGSAKMESGGGEGVFEPTLSSQPFGLWGVSCPVIKDGEGVFFTVDAISS